ncbi:hypothetical protein LEP1GSC052_0088 [Leptospira phage vb_LkmZ_Bejolso9-LE1]|nr:hypothetical protein LEP1GSC052_0088 [Leptospira phage vb_LkmZ_Bejolso9-LE1]
MNKILIILLTSFQLTCFYRYQHEKLENIDLREKKELKSLNINFEKYTDNATRLNVKFVAFLPLVLSAPNERYSPFDDVNEERIPIEALLKKYLKINLKKRFILNEITDFDLTKDINSDLFITSKVKHYFCQETLHTFAISFAALFLGAFGVPLIHQKCSIEVHFSVREMKSNTEIFQNNYLGYFSIFRGFYYNNSDEEVLRIHNRMIIRIIRKFIIDSETYLVN